MLKDLMAHMEFYFGKEGENNAKKLGWCGNMLELTQNEDYHDRLYTLTVKSDDGYCFWTGIRSDGTDETLYACAVKRVEAVYANGVREIPFADRKFSVPINFDDRAQKIILYFKYDLAEPLTLELRYAEADRAKWDKKVADEEAAKIEKEREEARLNVVKAAHISHRTGENLVNIYFQPCSENCVKTVINLYANNAMIAEYECGKGVYFKSVTGLAYGVYEYTVSQYGGDGAALFITDKIHFRLDDPMDGYRRNAVPSNVNGNW